MLSAPSIPSISQTPWGTTPSGEAVSLFTLRNANGIEIRITDYGGIVTALLVPDRDGQIADVVEGFDTLAGYTSPDYLKKGCHFGALIGRYANRIAGARFTLNGKTYLLVANRGGNQLHGGPNGFDKKLWRAKAHDGAEPSLELRLTSPDGDQGYPGTLETTVLYTLSEDNALRIDYAAASDADTVVNLTNHSYFNLKGAGDILGHELQIFADRFTPMNADLIPTGELRAVEGTPYDFTQVHTIGSRIGTGDAQIALAQGYDHNFVLRGEAGRLRLAARVHEPASGRMLETWTTEPGMQLYTSNAPKPWPGKGGKTYGLHSAVCLETQHFPNSPNQPDFPSTLVTPQKPLRETTLYRFSAA